MSKHTETQMVPMEPDIRDRFCSWVYEQWSESYDILKHVNTMEFNKKIDGDKESFSARKKDCLQRAEKEFAFWKTQKEIYCTLAYSPTMQAFKGKF